MSAATKTAVSAFFSQIIVNAVELRETDVLDHTYNPSTDECIIRVTGIPARSNLIGICKKIKETAQVRTVDIYAGDINGVHIFKLSCCKQPFDRQTKTASAETTFFSTLLTLFCIALLACLVFKLN
jgi:hypothetical protein